MLWLILYTLLYNKINIALYFEICKLIIISLPIYYVIIIGQIVADVIFTIVIIILR